MTDTRVSGSSMHSVSASLLAAEISLRPQTVLPQWPSMICVYVAYLGLSHFTFYLDLMQFFVHFWETFLCALKISSHPCWLEKKYNPSPDCDKVLCPHGNCKWHMQRWSRSVDQLAMASGTTFCTWVEFSLWNLFPGVPTIPVSR